MALAILWLVIGTFGCLGTIVMCIEPEDGANIALITAPLFVSGWGAVAGAIPTRKRGMPLVLVGPLGGAVLGFLLGAIVMASLYASWWPGFL